LYDQLKLYHCLLSAADLTLSCSIH